MSYMASKEALFWVAFFNSSGNLINVLPDNGL